MVTQVILPKLTETMDEGTLVQWLKEEGARVEIGELLFELDTDKTTIEVESSAAGILRKVMLRPGETARVGTVIAFIAEPEEALPDVSGPPPPAALAPDAPRPAESVIIPMSKSPSGPVRAAPAARRFADQHQVDLAQVIGSGPNGAILLEDVQAALSRRAIPAAVRGKRVLLSSTRQTTAKRMEESARASASVTLYSEADLAAAVSWKEDRFPKREGAARVTLTQIAVRAAALALRQHPGVNAHWVDGSLYYFDEINVGLAVALEDGLVVTVIREADCKSVVEIARIAAELAERARNHRLNPEEVAGGTFTVTSLGSFSIRGFTPLINLPEIAILGTGRVIDRPVAVSGQVVVHPMMDLSLTFDHRGVDGAPAAAFLDTVKSLLEQPEQLE